MRSIDAICGRSPFVKLGRCWERMSATTHYQTSFPFSSSPPRITIRFCRDLRESPSCSISSKSCPIILSRLIIPTCHASYAMLSAYSFCSESLRFFRVSINQSGLVLFVQSINGVRQVGVHGRVGRIDDSLNDYGIGDSGATRLFQPSGVTSCGLATNTIFPAPISLTYVSSPRCAAASGSLL